MRQHGLALPATLLMLGSVDLACAMVIQRVFGANNSEVMFASSGGGTHVYLAGTDLGSAFAPPQIFLGINAEAECVVQPFTSSRNRLHCIISAEGLPPPDLIYAAAGRFVERPLRVYKGARLAQCWHVGSANHGCIIRFDVGAAPRVDRLLTPVLQSGGVVRLTGQGIDGGMRGAPGMIMTLFRGTGQLVVGACGEKDCAPSNMGMETIGCMARTGSSGDGVASQEFSSALAFSDATNFGCKLDSLAGGLTGGFFNFSLHSMDGQNRGDAYLGFSGSQRVDYASGNPFYAELLPVITGVAPKLGSLAGGTDLTISGTGFGSVVADLQITVGEGTTCAVTAITPDALHCRVEPLTAPSDGWTQPPPSNPAGQAHVRQGLVSHPSQRGVRFQWRDDGNTWQTEHSHGGSGTMLLDDFSASLDYEVSAAQAE